MNNDRRQTFLYFAQRPSMIARGVAEKIENDKYTIKNIEAAVKEFNKCVY